MLRLYVLFGGLDEPPSRDVFVCDGIIEPVVISEMSIEESMLARAKTSVEESMFLVEMGG